MAASELVPLSQKLEAAIRARVDASVQSAFSVASKIARDAYGRAFREICGDAFCFNVCDALDEAEQRIAQAARDKVFSREIERIVKSLTESVDQ